jgi:NhaP-type Na+/H+ or K+/H+ antiporter
VAIGIAVALILTPLFRRLTQDIPVYLILTFLSGYGAYLLADALQCSGVLAVVALGMFYIRINTMTPELRIQGAAIWDIVVFLLNGLIFILIGLQMRSVIEHLSGRSLITLSWYAFIICLTAILIRIAWVFPGTYLPRLPARVRARDPFPPWQHAAIVAWTGMRGVVSLASALALPLVLANGQPFPQRDLIIFLTSSVILVTLVFQGLTLPLLIRWLKIEDDGGSEREENKARLEAAQARLKELASKDGAKAEALERVSHYYESRVRLFSGRYSNNQDEVAEKRFTGMGKLQLDLLDVEQAALIKLRNDEVINDEVLRTVQRDLDLEWLRLQDD